MINRRLLSKKNKEVELISELNVVPYIDVMLVLLIIFMVTTPLLQHSVEINLPETVQQEQMVDNISEPIIVTVDKDGFYYINASETALTIRDVTIKVIALGRKNSNIKTKVYIRGDKDARYNDIIKVISVLKNNGLRNIGLMSNSI
jgi:biopolymer transport protein TolR